MLRGVRAQGVGVVRDDVFETATCNNFSYTPVRASTIFFHTNVSDLLNICVVTLMTCFLRSSTQSHQVNLEIVPQIRV